MGPTPRDGAALAYDRVGGYDLGFGGEDSASLLGDTWSYSNGNWSDLNPSCPCPAARAFAAVAFDPALNETILFGGLAAGTNSLGAPADVPSADTWAWNATTAQWIDLTGSVTGAPTPRYAASMVWDADMGVLVLFGGNSGDGPLGDTWIFGRGAWSLLATPTPPAPRWGAGFANSSSGYDLLFGGRNLTGPLEDTWMLAGGAWHPIPVCTGCGPAGRTYPAMTEIPANSNILLFGGLTASGVSQESWIFRGSSSVVTGPTGNWSYEPNAPSPPVLWAAGTTSDFHRGIVLLFGGATTPAPVDTNVSWGYFDLYAVLAPTPPEVDQGVPFALTATPFGGNGPYTYDYTSLPPGCASNDSPVLTCVPTTWGIDALSVTLVDGQGRVATANASVQVDPLDARCNILSQYGGFFYTGIGPTGTFGVDASVFGTRPTYVYGSYGSLAFPFTPEPNGIWNATVDMAQATPGASLHVTAQFSNWTLHTSSTPAVVRSPAWLLSIADFPGVVGVFSPSGAGPWNESYSYTYQELWGLGELALFNLPVSFLSGAFSLLPVPSVTMTVGSSGLVGLQGGLSYPPPGLTFGPVTLQLNLPGSLSASVSLAGQFGASPASAGGYSIGWSSAWLNLSVGGSFNGSIPIASIDVPGLGEIGLSVDYSIAPTVALSLVLGPASGSSAGFLSGLGLLIERLYASLVVDVTATITLGIADVASIGGGGNLSLDLLFGSLAPYFLGVWLNGSIFVSASFLGWSATWSLVGPGTVWSWTADPPAAARPSRTIPAASPTAITWTPPDRYYNVSGYDQLNWTAGERVAVALPDIYPDAHPSLSGDSPGAALLYAADQVSAPVGTVGLEGLAVSVGNGAVQRLPALVQPGTALFDPQLTALPGGGYLATFDALPYAELGVGGPAGLTGFVEESSELAPGASSWSAPTPLVPWGFPQSPQLDSCNGRTEVAVLVTHSLFPSPGAAESVLVVDARTGALVANFSASDFARLSGLDCAHGLVVLQNASGGPAIADLVTGGFLSVPGAPAAGAVLRSVGFVNGTSDELLLTYSSPSAKWAVLQNLSGGPALATVALPQNSSEARAIALGGQTFLFVQETSRVVAFTVQAGSTSPWASVPVAHLTSFAVAESGGAFVLAASAAAGAGPEPITSLTLAIVGHPPPAAASSGSPLLLVVVYAELGALATLVAATAIAVRWKPRGPPGAVPSDAAPSEPTAASSPADRS